ncbi:MAG TPA: hypothetical protein VLH10_11930 [Yinghuangia sp.]|nr:hypothetical protein [Yinghuangia sp.]
MTSARRSLGGTGIVAVAALLMALPAGCDQSPSPSSGSAAQSSAQQTEETATAPAPEESSPATADGQASGIVFAALQGSSWIVAAIAPATGATTYEATFSPTDDDVRLDASFRQMTGGGPLAERALFSPDLRRAVALRMMADGSEHVGWIDRDGTFTDVTAANTTENGFASTFRDDTPSFGPDGAFYFARREPDGSGWKTDPTIWRLTGSEPGGAVSVEKLDDVNYYVDATSDVEPLCAGCSPFRTTGDPNLGAYRVTDFLDGDEYLSTDTDHAMVYRSPVKPKQDTSLMDWGTDGTPLIPETNRTVWAPVADPQGGQVAFLSTAVDQGPTVPPELYIVDARGGTPRLVPTGPGPLGGANPTLLTWL